MQLLPPPPLFSVCCLEKWGRLSCATCILIVSYVNPGPIPFRRLFLSSIPRPLCFPPLSPSPRLVPGPWFKMADGAVMEKVRAPTSRGVPVAVWLMLVLQHIQFGTWHLRVPAEQIFENRTVFRLRPPRTPPSLAGWPTGCPSLSFPGSYACSQSGSCRQPSSSRSETARSRPRATKTNSTHTTISDLSRAPTYRACTARRPSTRAR